MAEDNNNEPEDQNPDEPQEGDEQETDEPDSTDDDSGFDVDRAREKIRKVNSENRNLRKRAEEAERKAQENDNATERLNALEAENLRLRVGVKHGLPEAVVKRLNGTTEEEILQDAEELMELLGGKKPPTDQPRTKLRGGGDPTNQPDPIEDLDAFAAKVFN